jgi:leucyl aminopeptidase (aminopeptidase T)
MKTMSRDKILEGAHILISKCGQLKPGEKLLVVHNPSTREVAEEINHAAEGITDKVEMLEIPPFKDHGEEPSANVMQKMLGSNLCLGLTELSMAHTQARLKLCEKGGRYLSLPDYSLNLLKDPSLRVDYVRQGEKAKKVVEVFNQGETVRVKSQLGTDIELKIKGRTGNWCPGYVQDPGSLGSPPDIEVNVSPIEEFSNGVVVVDGSVPHPDVGVLKNPIRLTVREGKITHFDGEEILVQRLKRIFEAVHSEKAYILAECGVGFNDLAQLCGVMLVDEGAAGTMHFGFGSNSTVGGGNHVPFHLDFVFKNPSLWVDNTPILNEGILQI